MVRTSQVVLTTGHVTRSIHLLVIIGSVLNKKTELGNADIVLVNLYWITTTGCLWTRASRSVPWFFASVPYWFRMDGHQGLWKVLDPKFSLKEWVSSVWELHGKSKLNAMKLRKATFLIRWVHNRKDLPWGRVTVFRGEFQDEDRPHDLNGTTLTRNPIPNNNRPIQSPTPAMLIGKYGKTFGSIPRDDVVENCVMNSRNVFLFLWIDSAKSLCAELSLDFQMSNLPHQYDCCWFVEMNTWHDEQKTGTCCVRICERSESITPNSCCTVSKLLLGKLQRFETRT